MMRRVKNEEQKNNIYGINCIRWLYKWNGWSLSLGVESNLLLWIVCRVCENVRIEAPLNTIWA